MGADIIYWGVQSTLEVGWEGQAVCHQGSSRFGLSLSQKVAPLSLVADVAQAGCRVFFYGSFLKKVARDWEKKASLNHCVRRCFLEEGDGSFKETEYPHKSSVQTHPQKYLNKIKQISLSGEMIIWEVVRGSAAGIQVNPAIVGIDVSSNSTQGFSQLALYLDDVTVQKKRQ